MKKISILAILVLAISIFLIPSMCFADAAGSYSLSSIYVTMTEPKFNTVVPTDITASSKNLEVKNIVWTDSKGNTVANTEKLINSGTTTVTFEIARKGGDRIAARTSVFINNSSEGVIRSNVSSDSITITKSFSVAGGRLSNASGKASYMEGGEASTATTSDGKKELGLIVILITGDVKEGKSLPVSFQLKTDLVTEYKTYKIYKTSPSSSTEPYAVWQNFDETAEAGKSYTLRYIYPIPSDEAVSDSCKIEIDGKSVAKAGLGGNLFFDVTYKTGEAKAAEIYNTVSKVEFEDYVFPTAGQELNAQDIKLKAGFPGKIESANYTMFQKSIGGTATLNDNMELYIRVELNDGYKFSDPVATLNGKSQDMRIHNDSMGDQLYGFVWNYRIPASNTVKIVDQSPETVEFHEGEKVELFVKVEGEGTIEWTEQKVQASGGGAKQKFDRTVVITGANAEKYTIESATKELDGHTYGCRVTAPDKSIAYAKAMTLKLVSGEAKAEETKVEEAKVEEAKVEEAKSAEAKEETKEEAKPEETKTETKTEEKVEKIVWSQASPWAIDELNKANEAGLIPMLFNKMDLTQNITRKEFAYVSVRLYEKISGKKASPVAKNPFTDTKDEEILKANAVGITNGVTETTFAPDKEISREQMATMIARALDAAGVDTKVDLTKVKEFADDNEMHNWSRSAIYFMSNIEIIKGLGDNKFGVNNQAQRQQAIIISIRCTEQFAK